MIWRGIGKERLNDFHVMMMQTQDGRPQDGRGDEASRCEASDDVNWVSMSEPHISCRAGRRQPLSTQ